MNKQEEMAALAILIHDLRKHKKHTLKELADKIGRSVGFLSQVERGLSQPTVADLTAISETLGVPTTYFYSLPKPKQLPWVTRPDERRTLYLGNGITDILVSPKIRASFSMLESLLEAGASSGQLLNLPPLRIFSLGRVYLERAGQPLALPAFKADAELRFPSSFTLVQ